LKASINFQTMTLRALTKCYQPATLGFLTVIL
jgi:hypothetical protein